MNLFLPGVRTAVASATWLAATLSVRAISITPETDAANLVEVITGASISIVGDPVLIGGAVSTGVFSGGLASGIGIKEGIMLTSGDVTLIGNSNTSPSTSGDFGGDGYADLTALAGMPTFDATILTFDFETSTGDLFFNFVFASEEYDEWVNSPFNDVFAFWVDSTNLAVVPGTSTPISVNTINAGNPYGVYPPDATNSSYYVDNVGGSHAIEYDGFTVVMTASAHGLATGAGVKHTMRLAIADASDHFWDAGVFIQAGSFDEVEHEHDDHEVPDSGSTVLLSAIGLGSIIALRRRFSRA